MKVLVTGGAGFIGSHAAVYFAEKGHEVVALDNLSRGALLKKTNKGEQFNLDFIRKNPRITFVRGDVRNARDLSDAIRGCDVVIHAAAQTAVTTSVTDPEPDFENNVIGTFRVLEAVRAQKCPPTVVYCSTNKVYGDNVNRIGVVDLGERYAFTEEHRSGISEDFSVDHCEHTPYGTSKLTADLYMQDYARTYGIRTGVFRMSCIYGERQFGVEDQGWVAWFAIAAAMKIPITIFGDGKQVRDVLYVDDLMQAWELFIAGGVHHGVYNMGGGPENTLSLRELLRNLNYDSITYAPWRPSDQKVYVSDVTKARRELGWSPKISPGEGTRRLKEWAEQNIARF